MASRKGVLKACTLGCAAAMGLLLWIGWSLRSLERSFDLSTNPPREAFAKVFSIPPPPSIDDIKIAGYASMNGEAWIRLHVIDVDAALMELKRSPRGVTGPDKEYDKDFVEEMDAGNPSSPKYMRTVGWEELKQVKHPVSYHFPLLFQGAGWRGVMVLDRQRKLLLVEAQLF
ncbi:MAG: hypothetical protein JWL77_5747 [Chthonomonadaceae bacterium]|nr:hypothetical protein [Chthonomonadaceae bacterium]